MHSRGISFFFLSPLSANDLHSEVFVVVSLTLFLPICLEQFARDNGFLDPDHTIPCLSTDTTPSEARCSVKVGWLWIDSASFRSVVHPDSVRCNPLTRHAASTSTRCPSLYKH